MSVIFHGFETGRGERGFTLLELLVVVVLMSAMAWMALGVVTDNTSQIRFEDTRNRLAAIRQAIIGDIRPSAPENGMPSSFVADNGILPDSIENLVNATTLTGVWESFGSVIPVFDPTPGPDGFPDIPPIGTLPDEFPLDDPLSPKHPEVTLLKGHRGTYLNGVASDGSYRDGWGTDRSNNSIPITGCPSTPGSPATFSDVDAVNHGWCFTSYNEGLYVDSYGMDGEPDPPTGIDYDYERDVSMSPPVLRDDWKVNLFGRTVEIINQSGVTIDKEIGVSLLIFVNDDSGGNWRRVTSDVISGGCAGLDSGGNPLVHCGYVGFSALPPTDFIIPVGEHLMLLFWRETGVSDDNPDFATWLPPVPPATNTYVTARVKFFPRSGIPELKLVIR